MRVGCWVLGLRCWGRTGFYPAPKTQHPTPSLKSFRAEVGVLFRQLDGSLAAVDFDGEAPGEFAFAVDLGVDPPLAGRDVEGGLAALVQLRVDLLAAAHQARGELLEALAVPRLGVVLVARGRHVDGVELDGHLARRDGEADALAAQAHAEQGRALAVAREPRSGALVLGQTPVDA